jgi:transcriptional regulator with XRE-family HTH domain
MDSNNLFSTRIKNLRVKNLLTMREFAKILEISHTTISMWENNGCVPHAEMLMKISQLYDVSIDYLLGNEKE